MEKQLILILMQELLFKLVLLKYRGLNIYYLLEIYC